MKKVFGSGLALMLGMAGVGNAADLVIREPQPEPVLAAPFSWTGFYAGLNAGYAFGGDDQIGLHSGGVFLGDFGKAELSGFLGGGQIGYNYQVNNIVFGIEADFQGADINDSVNSGGVHTEAKVDWFGTVRPRIGYAFDRTLAYATGGLAYGHVKYEMSVAGARAIDSSETRAGWVAGAGLEHAFTDSISAKLEYQYVNLGDHDIGGGGFSTTPTTDFHSVRVGINFRF